MNHVVEILHPNGSREVLLLRVAKGAIPVPSHEDAMEAVRQIFANPQPGFELPSGCIVIVL
jgi:hypothetical protein